MASTRKTRVAIIGGGVAGITTAFAIASDPALRATHEITLYQMGWRLGGKGASGRNQAAGDRIEEHGLHVWLGFYDNAFRLMRSCYDQLTALGLRAPGAPLGSLDAAFKPLGHLLLSEHVGIGGNPPEWRPWLIELPRNDKVPGTATHDASPFDMFLAMLDIIKSFIDTGAVMGGAGRKLQTGVADRLRDGFAPVHAHAQTLPQRPADHSPAQTSLLVDLIEGVQRVLRDLMSVPANHDDDETRRALMLLDLGLAGARGLATSDVFTLGYDALDAFEATDWLRRNGASDVGVKSPIMRAGYDFIFGFNHGRMLAPDCGAGTGMRAFSRLLFTYRGALFFKMQAGMGDTIFAPYYQVLKALGVKFRFFNAASRLHLDADRTAVTSVEMIEQAVVKGGNDYAPLFTVKDLPVWPSQPLWDQIEGGDQGIDFESEASLPLKGRRYTIEVGRDFDQIVLAVSHGSLRPMTQELIAASPRWRAMIEQVRTVGTRAAQFWLSTGQDALGWRSLVEKCNPGAALPVGSLQTIITGFDEPLDTWADMTHLLPRENWPARGPKAIAYFCSPARDGETLAEFKQSVRHWLDTDLPSLWPDADAPGQGGFDLDDLYAKPGTPAQDRFDAQYFRVNMFGSERYVLSVTGSVFHRLAADESGFENLVIAGDWTRCGLNNGCVEAATMSGIAAASAVTGTAMLNVGADDVASDQTSAAAAMYGSSNTISGAPWPLTPLYARGEMNGWFIFRLMPRAEVEALLPRGMSLASNPLSGHGMHPVGFSFCQYHAVRGSFVPGFLAFPPYSEAIFSIPYVHTDQTGRARFLYPRRLYVDSTPAILAGRVFYAMDKVRARIDRDDRSFRAFDARGRAFIDANFVQHDDPAPLADHPAFGAIAGLSTLPFATPSPTGNRYNAFDMELEDAWAAPVSGRIKIADPHPGGFPTCDFRAPPLVRSHPHGVPGAVRIWCNWSMTNPFDSRRIRQSAMDRAFLRRLY